MKQENPVLRIAFASMGLALLAACTPADCDPTRADLFAGVGCTASGSYAARVTGLQNNLAAAQANELQQRADASRVAGEAVAAQQDLNRRRSQLAVLDGRWRGLQRQLDEASRRQNVDQAAVRDAEAKLAALRAKRGQATPQTGDADLRALESSTSDLERSLRQEGF